jgi:hypothetical protein
MAGQTASTIAQRTSFKRFGGVSWIDVSPEEALEHLERSVQPMLQ